MYHIQIWHSCLTHIVLAGFTRPGVDFITGFAPLRPAVYEIDPRFNFKLLFQGSTEYDNPPPGTIVDGTVTRFQFKDFFLVCVLFEVLLVLLRKVRVAVP